VEKTAIGLDREEVTRSLGEAAGILAAPFVAPPIVKILHEQEVRMSEAAPANKVPRRVDQISLKTFVIKYTNSI
jgi:hypothetical protein